MCTAHERQMTPAIDLDHLEKYVCGDASLLDEILSIFDEQASLWLDRLDPGLDDEEWRDAVHALKGASRGVGAWEVGDLCESAESLIAGIPEKVAKRRELLAMLRAKVSDASAEARRIRDQG